MSSLNAAASGKMPGKSEPRPCRRLVRTALIVALFVAVWSTIHLYTDQYNNTRREAGQVVKQEESSPLLFRDSGLHVVQVQQVNHTSFPSPQINVVAADKQHKVDELTISNDSTKVDNRSSSITQSDNPDQLNSCVWSPYSQSQCSEMLRKRLKLPLTRFLLFGDSTIHNLFWDGILHTKLVDEAFEHCPFSSCQVRTTDRCDLTYGLPPTVPDEFYWKPNLTKGEGPAAFGYNNPRCSDCSGCSSHFLDCIAKEPEKRCLVPHGGFVHMEFARDVVWQTLTFRTTQENTADFLHDRFATYPNTACVMAAGLHDMDVPFNDVATYIRNVNWYLSLYLDHVCEHVIWLANASPASDNYTQTIARTKEWNEAVEQELSVNFLHSTTYINLWSASQTGFHSSNLHMGMDWNIQLSDLFIQLWFRDVLTSTIGINNLSLEFVDNAKRSKLVGYAERLQLDLQSHSNGSALA